MKLKFLSLILLASLAFQANAAKYAAKSINKIVIDGKVDEWPNPLPNYDKKTTIRFDFANNSKFIYFVMRVDDLELQKNIMTNGLDIWINKKGRQLMETAVTYPCPSEEAVTIDLGGRGGFNPMAAMSQASSSAPAKEVYMIDSIILTGFYIENGKQGIRNCPVKVAIAKGESSCMLYEIAIPVNSFWKEELEKSDVKKAIQVAFVLKGKPSPTLSFGGRGGMDMGRMMRGMPGMTRNQRASMQDFLPAEYRDKLFWFKAQLNADF